MRLDEPARRSLYGALADALGDNQADTLMNLLPTHPLADMATRDDLQALAISVRGEMAAGFGAVDRQFAEVRAEMHDGFGAIDRQFGEIQGQFGEIQGRFGEIQGQFGEIQGQFGEQRSELARDMRTNTIMLMMMNLAVATIIATLGVSGAFA